VCPHLLLDMCEALVGSLSHLRQDPRSMLTVSLTWYMVLQKPLLAHCTLNAMNQERTWLRLLYFFHFNDPSAQFCPGCASGRRAKEGPNRSNHSRNWCYELFCCYCCCYYCCYSNDIPGV